MAEGAVPHDADALLEAVGEGLLLLAPVEHVIADLRDVHPARAHAFGEHGTREVRHAYETRPAGAHHLLQRPHGVLERRTGIGPVHEEHVDPVGAEASQARIDLGEDVRPARVTQRPGLPRGRYLHPTLGDEDHVAPPLLERPGHHLLGVARTIGGRGVYTVHPEIERAMDGLDGFVVLDRAVAVARHGPAAEPHHGHLQAGTAERTVAHEALAVRWHSREPGPERSTRAPPAAREASGREGDRCGSTRPARPRRTPRSC